MSLRNTIGSADFETTDFAFPQDAVAGLCADAEYFAHLLNAHHIGIVFQQMFDAALRNTRIEMSPAERRQFYEKHIRHMTLTIDENGNVSIELKRG